MTDGDKKDFQKLIKTSFTGFWDDVLEPAFNRIDDRFDGVDKRFDGVDKRFDGVEDRLDNVEERLHGVEKELNHVGSKTDSVDRRLAAETTYRDKLEKRVVRIENKLDLPHHS
ncbi:MAG: hypothetical protein A2Z42_04695 [Candidatus Woykebacteria bacterium RBG_19FT_COMBO_43_10]|uniref:t-SNARE coiled-coil homology domain-containing protein n=1 Tax=Candidatus Woykebacteria bacterium RBG_19FT_COMBO_43_10 TaxID=1802598 RepID=A0A1G1WFF6_9BACT|nr:MAG: hypothetical protein A2Z42_04695 [Candidatus Woykebacteria bacterium RBG_19FT_COMBO_43_10]